MCGRVGGVAEVEYSCSYDIRSIDQVRRVKASPMSLDHRGRKRLRLVLDQNRTAVLCKLQEVGNLVPWSKEARP